jgi:glucose-1-phosphate cytidylyltransferase
MRHYVQHGMRRFILACGHGLDEYAALLGRLGSWRGQEVSLGAASLAGSAAIVDTGLTTMTGDRLRRVRPWIEAAPWFWVTYSDTLSSVDLQALARFHLDHGKIATCLAARLPTRFRILGIRRGESEVRGFAARPVIQADFINGGFYAFRQEIFAEPYLGSPANEVLEERVLETLARNGELMAFAHDGPWQHFDTERDLRLMAELVEDQQR